MCVFRALLPRSLAHFEFKGEMNRFEFFEINYHHCHGKCIRCLPAGVEKGGGDLLCGGAPGGDTCPPSLGWTQRKSISPGLVPPTLRAPPTSGWASFEIFFSTKINALKCHLLRQNLSTLLYTIETAIPDKCATLKFGLELPRGNVGCNLCNSLYIYAI